MMAGPAEDLTNYHLVSAGGDRRFGTRDDRSIPVVQATYDALAGTVTLAPLRLLSLRRMYQLTVNGRPPGGLVSTSGVYLAGNGQGQAGTDYTTTFGREILVTTGHVGRMRVAVMGARRVHARG